MSDEAAGDAGSLPGAALRRAREARGWTAAHAAELMRVPAGVVEALEADRYAELGAAVFARGHLRRYAALLGLAEGALIEAYDRSHAGPAAPSLIPAASAHTPVRGSGDRLRLPPAAWYGIGAALVALVLAGGWWWWNQRRAAEPVPPVAAPAAEAGGEAEAQPQAGDATADPLAPAPIPEAAPLPDPAAEAP